LAEGGPETALSLAGKASRHLAERGIENARLESELMLAAVLGLKRLDLYLQYDRPINEQELERFRAFVRRRLKREPLQYVLGHAPFRRLELQVDRRVLIPRPETEILVGEVIDWLKKTGRLEAGQRSVVLDLGTGSGAIALSVAQETGARVVATDASADALAVACANARQLGLESQLEFRAGSLWEPIRSDERFAAIVSNPPYVADADRAALTPEVRDWEPESALFAGPDGLDVIRAIVAQAPAHLEASGLLALEVGADQAAAVSELCATRGGYHSIRIRKDLAGRERVVLAESETSRK
jgi:release factor glutamine methyltransferase